MFSLVPLVVAVPIAGLLINLLFGRRLRQPGPGIVASLAAGLSFIAAVLQFLALLNRPEGAVVKLAEWIHIGDLDVAWAFQVDTLSVMMMLVVTGVGTLIHVYAIEYMRGDERFSRFFVYLNLFLASMLVLVTASNYLMLFAGWELVGLCSYLLIGFWFDKQQNATAGRKAFVVNRIGDLGFLLALFLVFQTFHTLNFQEVFDRASRFITLGAPVVNAITFCLLLGVAGKSAQIPLYVWLPDAMAGPTPVSALIHAATMVTAGIYLIVRSQALFALAPATQLITTVLGAITALWAATIAIGQFDIKRVLAYSTISQLGFMVAAAGLGAYVAALFHLIAHAFFKALLFLAAGAVIKGLEHGLTHTSAPAGSSSVLPPSPDWQDMRLMGGLRSRMPLTFIVYLIGALALVGLPPLAGFFSKDEILASAYDHNRAAYLLLTAAAFCTAFYSGRQIFLVFFGEARSAAAAGATKSSPLITGTLILLAVFSIVGGGLNLPGQHSLALWLGHTLGEVEVTEFNWVVAGISTALALVGLGLAYWLYGRRPLNVGEDDPLSRLLGPLFQAFNRAWWVDAFYNRAIIQPYNRLSAFLSKADVSVLFKIEQSIVRTVYALASGLRRLQTGQLNWNMAGLIIGLALTLFVLAWRGLK